MDEEPAPGRLADADLKTLLDAVCEASGFWPQSPARIDTSLKLVEEWRDRGLDFDLVVLPAIRHVISHRSDPVKGLWAFRDRVNHEAARLSASPAASYEPPASPIVSFEDEDQQMGEIRAQLLARLGPDVYSLVANDVRLEPVEGMVNGRQPLRLHPRGRHDTTESLRHGRNAPALRKIAEAHGFNEVW